MIDFHISNEEYLNDLMELVRPFESRTDVDLKLDVDYFRQKMRLEYRFILIVLTISKSITLFR